MSDLLVTVTPENFRSKRPIMLPGDIYNVCERVREKYPNLTIILKDDGSDEPYVIAENCTDGNIRFVTRYKELTPQIIEDLDYMQRVPYAKRVEEAERRAKLNNEKLGKPDEEKQYKWMAEFRKDLIKAGFVHAAGGSNYRRMGKLPKRTKRRDDG